MTLDFEFTNENRLLNTLTGSAAKPDTKLKNDDTNINLGAINIQSQ